jgi:thiamine-phosphate pyrophosphorylase
VTLAGAHLYLVTRAEIRGRPVADLLPELAGAGVDLIQLREKEMEAGDLLRAGAPLRDACASAGVPFIVNDRPDIALALEADGVHLGQNDLPVEIARRIVGSALVGVSTHREAEVDAAVNSQQRIDYVAVGPVEATPTKPGRPGVGLDLVRYAARVISQPWFVTGGMNPETLPDAIAAGARRIVVVRAITEAADPVAAAGELRRLLDAAPVDGPPPASG